jgi:hypothetical protein
VQNLVVEEAAHELVNAVVERCREEQTLSRLRGLVHDAGNDGQEAQVGHVVCFIEHGDFDGIEGNETLFHEVFETTGASDNDVDAGLESGDLALLGYPTEDRCRVESVGLSQRFNYRADLGGEFTSWCENESERTAGTTSTAGKLAAQTRNQRNGERESLAGTGLSATENIAASQSIGKRVDLDRERFGEPLSRKCCDEGSGHAKRAKSSVSHCVWCLSGNTYARNSDHGAKPCPGTVRESGEGGNGHIRSPEKVSTSPNRRNECG